jgi:hypothetical protein
MMPCWERDRQRTELKITELRGQQQVVNGRRGDRQKWGDARNVGRGADDELPHAFVRSQTDAFDGESYPLFGSKSLLIPPKRTMCDVIARLECDEVEVWQLCERVGEGQVEGAGQSPRFEATSVMWQGGLVILNEKVMSCVARSLSLVG